MADAATAATSTDATAPAKSHYVVLDGLRGVAALTVVVFHVLETFTGGDPRIQIINHGYLAVDFFFLLSGFVVAYAYDDRWGRMRLGEFAKRRLIRLQPMVVMGSLIGAALFYSQAGPLFPPIATTPVWQLLLVMLLGMTLLPLPPAYDIRGWQEMHPLNGPAWSLFFEYVANILYALVLRRLGRPALTLVVAAAGLFLAHYAVTNERGDLIGGWALDAKGLYTGFARMLFPFTAGILLMRSGRRIHSGHAFGLASLLLLLALALPRIGSAEQNWLNGLYEAGCVILLFPLIVAIGAGEKRADGASIRIARFFGALSYPLYITHYPLIYLYTHWVVDEKPPLATAAVGGVALVVAAVAIAWACLKLYDEPVRRRLATRLLRAR